MRNLKIILVAGFMMQIMSVWGSDDIAVEEESILSMVTERGVLTNPESFFKETDEELARSCESVKFDMGKLYSMKISVPNIDLAGNILHLAAMFGKTNFLNKLFQSTPLERRKEALKITASNGYNALHLAVMMGHLGATRFLSDLIPIKILTLDKHNAFHLAVIYGHDPSVRYFVEERYVSIKAHPYNNHSGNSLHMAIANERKEILEYLLTKNDITSKKRPRLADLVEYSTDWYNGLHAAVRSQKLDMVKYLIDEKKMDINGLTKNGRNVVFLALYYNALNIVKYFIEEKKIPLETFENHALSIKLNQPIKDYLTMKREKIVYLKQSIIDNLNKTGFSVLNILKNIPLSEILEIKINLTSGLKKNNPDINHEVNLLQIAVMMGKYDLVSFLVENKKMDTNVLTQDGLTLIGLSRRNKRNQITEYLIQPEKLFEVIEDLLKILDDDDDESSISSDFQVRKKQKRDTNNSRI